MVTCPPPQLEQGHPERAELNKIDLEFLKNQKGKKKKQLVKLCKITYSGKILSQIIRQ